MRSRNANFEKEQSKTDLERGDPESSEMKNLSLEEYVQRELIQRDYLIELMIRVYKLLKQNCVNLQWSKYLSIDRDVYAARTHSRIVEISFGILKAPIEVTDELDRRNNGRGRLGTKTSQFRNHAKSLSLGVQSFVHVLSRTRTYYFSSSTP